MPPTIPTVFILGSWAPRPSYGTAATAPTWGTAAGPPGLLPGKDPRLGGLEDAQRVGRRRHRGGGPGYPHQDVVEVAAEIHGGREGAGAAGVGGAGEGVDGAQGHLSAVARIDLEERRVHRAEGARIAVAELQGRPARHVGVGVVVEGVGDVVAGDDRAERPGAWREGEDGAVEEVDPQRRAVDRSRRGDRRPVVGRVGRRHENEGEGGEGEEAGCCFHAFLLFFSVYGISIQCTVPHGRRGGQKKQCRETAANQKTEAVGRTSAFFHACRKSFSTADASA